MIAERKTADLSAPSVAQAPIALIRYGAAGEVARFACEPDAVPARGATVVVQTSRGLESGTVLQSMPTATAQEPPEFQVVRTATADDLQTIETLRTESRGLFAEWEGRIRQWKLDLDLIDLEWTFDRSKLILYVLTGRGPDTTKLAIQAAAAGLNSIEVQPIGIDGLALKAQGGGGGCGSGGCSH